MIPHVTCYKWTIRKTTRPKRAPQWCLPHASRSNSGFAWSWPFAPSGCDTFAIYRNTLLPGLVKIRRTVPEICERDFFSTHFGAMWSDPQSSPFHAIVPLTTCANLHRNRFICFQNLVFTRTNGRMNRLRTQCLRLPSHLVVVQK